MNYVCRRLFDFFSREKTQSPRLVSLILSVIEWHGKNIPLTEMRNEWYKRVKHCFEAAKVITNNDFNQLLENRSVCNFIRTLIYLHTANISQRYKVWFDFFPFKSSVTSIFDWDIKTYAFRRTRFWSLPRGVHDRAEDRLKLCRENLQ